MKIFNKQKGITIIALSVTIVILLILTGITLNFALGENGLIKSTQNAKELAEIDDETSTIKRATLATLIRSKANDLAKDELDRSLEGEFGSKASYTLDEDENLYIVNITKSKRSYLVDKSGNVSSRGKWGADYTTGRISINGEEVKSGNVYLEIGDTIAGYDPTNGATYNEVISYGESTEAHPSANGYADTVFRLQPGDGEDEQTVSYNLSQGWKLLGVTSSGNLIITTAEVVSPVSVGETNTGNLSYHLYGRTGYQNVVEELDKVCSLYGQGSMAQGSRSIKMEDVNRVTGYNPENIDGNGNPYKIGETDQYGNKVTFYWDGTLNPYYETENGLSGNCLAHYNFFLWDGNNWNTQAKSQTATNENKEKIIEIISTSYTYTKASAGGNTKAKNMIFKWYMTSTKVTRPNDYGVWYQLICMGGSDVKHGNLALSYGNLYNTDYSVRPVVILDNNININYVNGVWTVSAEEN